jgi:hypothetical protein
VEEGAASPFLHTSNVEDPQLSLCTRTPLSADNPFRQLVQCYAATPCNVMPPSI